MARGNRTARIEGGGRTRRWTAAATAVVLAAAAVFVGAPPALAGAGSLVSGVVWADTDVDQVQDAGEPVRSGIAVELLASPAGAVMASTTTNAQGQYAFSGVADGVYVVRVTAPVQFTLPDAVAGSNDFASTGNPAPGQPEQGITAPITIAGATQATGLDAGLQPLATIQVAAAAQGDACQGLITTGTAPFDATDGGGKDTGTANCLVRTADATTQLFSVSLTGLPTGGSVSNVVLDITASSANGAVPTFTGPGANGLPTGCLVSGVSPASSVVRNPDGSAVLHCNLGTFTSAVALLQVPVTPTGASLDGSTFHLTAAARAAGGDAIASSTVTNPDVQVTGAPQWDVSKSAFFPSTTLTTLTINGTPQTGYYIRFLIRFQPLTAKGATVLASPLTFTDRLSIQGAVVADCATTNSQDGSGFDTPGSIGCPPAGTPVGPSGATYTVSGMQPQVSGYKLGFFLPLQTAYRILDPSWTTGSPVPTGTIPLTNAVVGTDGYRDASGALNYGSSATPGFEPGWDGTTASGNNVASFPALQVAPPAPGIPGSGKRYFSPLGGCCSPQASAGNQVGTQVRLFTDAQTTVTDPTLVDVFDVSLWRMDVLPTPPAGYLVEYAAGPNTTNLQTGPPVNGLYPFDSTDLRAAATTGDQSPGPYGPWVSDPTTFGAGWRDVVNMVRLRPINPTTFLPASSQLALTFYLRARSVYNGGPHAGEPIPRGVRAVNDGGWTDPTKAQNWSTGEATLTYSPLDVGIAKSPARSQYQPGESVVWTLRPQATAGSAGATVHQVVVTDTLPPTLQFDAPCTQAALPSGVTLAYNPATRVVTFSLGDVTLTGSGTPFLLQQLTLCSTLSTLATPGTTATNSATIATPDAPTVSTTSSIQVNGTGQLALQKSVDRPLVAPGQTFTWRLDWSNTTANVPFGAPDLIDVFPWNGDGASGALSKRDQYASDFTGTTGIQAALAQPTYAGGATGDVPGTWYYATAASSTIAHDARAASNADPEAPGGLWQTADEVAAGTGFAAVTAVRFVSAAQLLPAQTVRAVIPSTATPAVANGRPVLDGLYVDRAMIYSSTFPQQPLPSNEPYVLMPGFTLGDLVWLDRDVNGVLDAGDEPVAGVPIEVLDANGAVVATATTNGSGRWAVESLAAGTYRALIPASAFAAGQPLAGRQVILAAASTDPAIGETLGNKNTGTPQPATSGLTSAPVTFAYTTAADGSLTGGNQPARAAADPGHLLNPFLPIGFMNMNVDLAVAPVAGIAIEKSADRETITAPGQRVTYTFTVMNTGELTLSGVGVDDTQADPAGSLDAAPTCDTTTLQSGASTTCSATYTVTQADIDNGHLDDTATAHGTPPGGLPDAVSEPDQVSIPVSGADPGIRLVKAADTEEITAVGQRVTYTFTVTNTGALTLTGIAVQDAQLPPAGDLDAEPVCAATTLAPGASTTCTAAYTATQTDMDHGLVEDVATATGTPPRGAPPVESEPDDLSIPVTGQVPGLSIEKSADTAAVTAVGQVVTYTFQLSNTGDLTLTDVAVADVQTAPAGPLDAPPVCAATVLAPGASTTCTATYTVIQADLDNGSVDDTARALGTSPSGGRISSQPDGLTIPVSGQTAGIALEKSADTDTITAPGQVVTYAFRVTNTGTLTLTDIAVDDRQAPPAASLDGGPLCAATTLAPGASTTCTATYTVTQADLDHGRVDDTATASGSPTGGGDRVESEPDAVSIPVTGQTASLTIVKTADTTRLTGPGQVVEFSFLLTNTGSLTLTDVTVEDVQSYAGDTATPVQCPSDRLIVGGTMTCHATLTVTPGAFQRGRIGDVAQARAEEADGETVESPEAELRLSAADDGGAMPTPTPTATTPPPSGAGTPAPAPTTAATDALPGTGLDAGPWLTLVLALLFAGAVALRLSLRSRRR